MEFVHCQRTAFVELNQGQTKLWRLPPMTAGPIIIKAWHVVTPRDRPGRPPRPLRGDRVPDVDVGMYAAADLTLELLRGGQVLARHPNRIFHPRNPNAGDIWALRVSREESAPSEDRRYAIEVSYPSVLPLLTRTIPMGFFSRGFATNWDSNPVLTSVQFEGGKLYYRWNEQFAALYGWPRGQQEVLLHENLRLPHIRMNTIRFVAGGGAWSGHERPFVQLSLRFNYVSSSRTAKFVLPFYPDLEIELPDILWIDTRFYLAVWGEGRVGYYVRIESSLLDALDREIRVPSLSDGVRRINLKQEVKRSIEFHLTDWQIDNGINRVDRHLRPWLVGNYEVEDVGYDRSADAMVLRYAGRQPPRPSRPIIGDGGNPVNPHSAAPRLFDLPFEEPLPADLPLPRPVHGGTSGALSKIEHIVVLMQENRSFDQVLGYLSRDGMLPRSRLLSGDESAGREPPQAHVDGLLPGDNVRDAILYPDRPGGRTFRSTRTRTTGWPSFELDNPCHSRACVERQIADDMKGFVADFAHKPGMSPAKLELIMHYLTDAELPAYGALAREFAICDRWFCSFLGGTLPNRFISLTGDLSRDIYGSPEVENPSLAGGFAPIETRTFFDILTARQVSWKLFEHGYSTLRLFRNFTFDETNIVSFASPTEGFAALARAGRLPAVSFIEPDYIELPNGNDDHAPADMFNGQRLIANIVSALLGSPVDANGRSQWDKTLLIITYDEHGGFYDHVLPPDQIMQTAPDGTATWRDIPPLVTGERRLGVRVPAFVISPLIPSMPGGTVNVAHTIYDHTTIPATILRRFCGPVWPVLSARMAGMRDLRDVLTLDEPRPRSDFDALALEMGTIASRPPVQVNGEIPAAPLRAPAPDGLEDDFRGLIAYASSVTGLGPA